MKRAALEITKRLKGADAGMSISNETRAKFANFSRVLSSSGAGPSSPQAATSPQAANEPASLSDKASKVLNQPAISQGFSAVPPEAKFLGISGLIPFLALAPPIATGVPLMPTDLVSNAATLQIGYGATIASFLGGIHWAMAMAKYGDVTEQARRERYVWSVTPTILTLPALAMQPGPGSLVVGMTLTGAYFVDKSFAQRKLLPDWYMSLRLPLTLAAVGGLAITTVASFQSHVPKKGNAIVQEAVGQ